MESLDPYAIGMIIVFVLGYFMITIEHVTHINKATCALLMAIICWILQFANKGFEHQENITFLGNHLANISQVVFFLLGAIGIVEIIDAHKGFKIISDRIQIHSKRQMLWVVGLLAFFLSAVLDNLTTTILMVSLVKKMIDEGDERLLIGGAVVIAANAGGAWTPIGDITTTMLWIGGQISTFGIMKQLFIPSLVCVLVSLGILTYSLKGNFAIKEIRADENDNVPYRGLIFALGIGSLIFVPFFKYLTGLPPFMGILLGLSVLWLVTDILHSRYEDRKQLMVPHILTKIDMSGILFFLGILLCINSLESAGILEQLAHWLDKNIPNVNIVAAFIGIASAIVDNVPLVAACMGMYDMTQYPQDSTFWVLVAYAAGTGGSMLIIGSAAGVAFMGLEKVDFFWFLKRISFAAMVGYFAGMASYLMI